MSTTVDNRVLEMRFDNAQFEKGVATSMSTLDKLKQKLNLSGASKGLENVGKAAKNMNFSGMTAGITQMKSGMMSLEGVSAGVIAKFTVINDMARSLYNTGKRMVSALTIDPVKTGFQEYETQIGAIQTILSNTRQEGTNVEIVNRALDELNEYADKTIYNFTEMTRNIGTFTAVGVKLDTSVNAIKGIANLAAVSGSTSQQASTAMYQLSQALAAGKVSLMDWNSVVNAGMGGKVFQDALVRTSELLGTGAKKAIDTYGSFRESLTKGEWLTTEVLTETLNQLSGAYDKADLISQGFTEDQANDIMALAKDAEDAATKVKTFTQLWDVMKEAAQSGWAQTWRIIVGDFEEAKALLTPLADFFTGIIGKFSDARNKLLEGGLSRNFTEFKMFDGARENINKALEPIKKVGDTVDKVTSTITDLGQTIDDVLLGKFGNGQERIDKLTESGINWMEVQNGVNEKLGDSYRYTKEQIEAQDELLGSKKKSTGATEEESEATKELTEEQKKRLIQMSKMSNAELRNAGYTETQIAALQELKDVAEQLGIPFDEFINKLDEINGRWLLIDSFKNIGESLGKVLRVIGSAWRQVFDPIRPEQIFNAMAAFHKFTETLKMNGETTENLHKTFRGLFTILDIIATITSGGLKVGFKVLSTILGAFDMNILDLTANIGDAIVAFRDWLFSGNAVAKAIDGLVAKLPGAINKIKKWFNAFKETPAVEGFIEAIEKIKEAISNFSLGEIDVSELASSLGENLAKALKSIPSMMIQIGKDVIAGFQNGIREGISGSIIGDIINFCAEFISAFAAALGVHSPSTITFAIAGFVIAGFVLGLTSKFPVILDVIKYIGEQIINAFKFVWDQIRDENGNIKWDKIFAGAVLVSGLLVVKQFVDAMKGIADGIGGIGDILENAADSLKSFAKVLNSYAWDLKAKAIQKMAISIAILVGAIWVLTKIDDPKKLWSAVGVIAVLAGVVAGLAYAMELMSKSAITYEKGKLNIEGLKASILQIGATLLMLAFVVKIIGDMNPAQAAQGFIGLTAMMVELVAFMAVVGLLVKSDAGENIHKVGKLMTKLAFAMMLMTLVVKLASGLSAEEMLKGAAFATAFGIFVMAITKVAKSAGNNVGKVGGMVLKISIAMGLMVGIIKLIDLLSPSEMLKGAAFATAFVIFVKALVKSTAIGKKQQIAKLGGLLMSISFSLLLMVGVCKLIGTLSIGDMVKGAAFIGAFLIFLKALIKISSTTSKGEMVKIGGTILALSVAIGILAGVSTLMGMLSIANLAKGITAIGLLSTFMTTMIKALKGINASKHMASSLMKLVIAIGVMALAVTALSLIDTKDLAAATVAMGSLMGMFALMSKSMTGLTNVKSGPILSMVVVIGAMATVIFLLRNVDPKTAIGSATALSELLLATSASLMILDGMNTSAREAAKAALALSAMAAPLAAFALTLRLMTGVEDAVGKAKALTILAGAATVLALAVVGIGAVIGMTGGVAVVPIIAGLVAMAAPLLVLVGILKLMEGIDKASENVDLLTKMMNTMIKTLTVLAVIGPLALVGVGAMAGLTALMGAIGVLATGIGALVDKFPSIKTFLDTGLPILEQLAGSIGTMVGKFGEGLSDSLPTIGDNITSFMEKLASASEAASGIKAESFDGVFGLCKSLLAVGGTSVGVSIADTLVGAFTGDKDATAMEKFETDATAFFTALKNISGSMTGFALPDNFSSEDIITLIDTIKSVGTASVGMSLKDYFTKLIGDETAIQKFETDGKAFFSALKNISADMSGFALPEDFSSEDITTLINAIKSVSTASVGTSFKDYFTKLIGDETAIKKFETDGKAFFSALKNISSDMSGFTLPEGFSSESITTLIDAIKSVSTASVGTSFKDIFTNLVGDETAIQKFETDGKAFFSALKNISADMTGFSMPEDFSSTSITTLLDAIKSIGDYGTGATWDDIFTLGGTSMEKFETDGKAFFKAIKGIATESMGITFGSIPLASIVIDMIKGVIEKTKGIDYSGVSKFTGIGTGGIGADGPMHDIAEAIKDFSDTVVGIDTAAVSTSVVAATMLRNLLVKLQGLDPSGAENFKIDSVGKAMKNYGNSVKDLDPGKVASSITSANRLKNFIASLAGLDSSGISNFKVGSIGNTMRSYSNAVKDVDVAKVSSSITAANKLKNFINSLSGLDSSGVSNFKIGSIGKSLSSYSSSVAGVDLGAISNSVAAANKLKSFISSLSGLDTSGVSSFTSAISTLGKTNVSGLMKSFSGASGKLSNAGSNLMSSVAKGMKSKQSSLSSAASAAITTAQKAITSKSSSFMKAGSDLMSKLVAGINSQKGKAASAVGSAVSSAASKIRSYYSSFHANGVYLGTGLVSGINSQKTSAYNAGYALGQAAVQGEKDGQASNSPSKLTIQAGKWLGEGLVIGIEKMGRKVYNAGHDLGDNAANSMSKSISKVSDLINTGIDSTPTIRPVVDLTNVRSGVGAISGMFNSNSSYGVMANLNAVNYSMNRRNQNVTTSDVVDAIDKMRRDLNNKNLGNTTYNSIGGVTYDGGTEVSDAVSALVRAMRIEGRV